MIEKFNAGQIVPKRLSGLHVLVPNGSRHAITFGTTVRVERIDGALCIEMVGNGPAIRVGKLGVRMASGTRKKVVPVIRSVHFRRESLEELAAKEPANDR